MEKPWGKAAEKAVEKESSGKAGENVVGDRGESCRKTLENPRESQGESYGKSWRKLLKTYGKSVEKAVKNFRVILSKAYPDGHLPDCTIYVQFHKYLLNSDLY